MEFVALSFLVGFFTMGFEMAASRLLAPWFGSSIVVWGTLITTLLAGIASGAFIGGQLTKLNKGMNIFGIMMVVCGGMIALSSISASPVIRMVESFGFEHRANLIICSNLLFLLPSVLLGTSTPYLVGMAFKKGTTKEAGALTGLISSASTFGSIAGTLMTSFYLLVWWGVDVCMNVFAMGIVCIGLISFALWRSRGRSLSMPKCLSSDQGSKSVVKEV